MEDKPAINLNDLPNVTHEVLNEQMGSFLSLPQAKFKEIQLVNGMTQSHAVMMRPIYDSVEMPKKFVRWEEAMPYHFKLIFSPSRDVIRLELYDTLLFPLLLEQIMNHGYSVISSGEDVEFATIKEKQNGWLGWAHLVLK